MAHVDWARVQLRAAGDALTAIRSWLKGVQACLPGSEGSPADDLDEPDVPTHMRAVIANGLNDRLDPLIRDLFEVTEYQAGSEGAQRKADQNCHPGSGPE